MLIIFSLSESKVLESTGRFIYAYAGMLFILYAIEMDTTKFIQIMNQNKVAFKS